MYSFFFFLFFFFNGIAADDGLMLPHLTQPNRCAGKDANPSTEGAY